MPCRLSKEEIVALRVLGGKNMKRTEIAATLGGSEEEKWVHLLGPTDGKVKVDSFHYAVFFIPARGGTPSGNCC